MVINMKAQWDGEEAEAPPPPLVLQPARLLDPRSIPPRRWLYGTQLVRAFVTVLVSPGGTGKTAYSMAVGAALASGIALLGEHVFERVNVAILNLEDPMDELNRRLAAIRLRYRLGPDELANRYFLHSGEDRPLVMASTEEGGDGFKIVYPDEIALINEVQTHNIGMIVVDPFAESHTLEENSNPQMIKAAAAWRRVARATDCAIMLVHHVRKGVVTDIDSARGAKALTDSARVGLLMSPMTEDEAGKCGVEKADRTRYVRLDDAKANMAPKDGAARWFHMDRVNLGNGTPQYPSGDHVAVLEQWTPPTSPFGDLTSIDCNAALDAILAGPEPGVLFTMTKKGGSTRWVGKVLMTKCGRTEEQAKEIIDSWCNSGLIFETDYKNAQTRQKQTGVTVNPSKRPT